MTAHIAIVSLGKHIPTRDRPTITCVLDCGSLDAREEPIIASRCDGLTRIGSNHDAVISLGVACLDISFEQGSHNVFNDRMLIALSHDAEYSDLIVGDRDEWAPDPTTRCSPCPFHSEQQ